MRKFLIMSCGLLIAACVSSHPDHFYALDAGRSQQLAARSRFAMQVHLRVSLPVMVDRSEIVLSNPNGVTILEHERWAAPLSEQFRSVLGQAIEARRQDLIVASQNIAEPEGPTTVLAVDVVQLTLQKSAGATMEVRWRMKRGSEVTQGREVFSSMAAAESYAGLVQSLNSCISSLADRLVAQLSP